MKNIRLFLVATFMLLVMGAYNSSAQIYVRVRPDRPHYERVARPGPRHVRVDEEWEPRGGTYNFTGGHWVEPPRPHARWVAGRWRHSHHGYVWVSGRWR